MSEFLIKAAQLILSLSILIVLHEMGHMIPAKLFKTRVEKFYLFFNPWLSVFRTKKVNGQRKISWFSKTSPKEWDEDPDSTEYGLGWLPLGGYVKIAGMIDESMDSEQMKQEPQPWEFRSKPAWQRLIIMIGGVTVNFILALFIYSMVLWVYGKEYLPAKEAKYGVHVADEAFTQPGMFQEGDRIISVGGEKVTTYAEASTRILIDGERTLKVDRNGAEETVHLPADFDQIVLSKNIKGRLFSPRFPVVIKTVESKTGASEANLLAGDSIVSINGEALPFFLDFRKRLDSLKNQTAKIGFYRNNERLEKEVNVSEKGTLGFVPMKPGDFLHFEVEKFGFFESIPAGISQGFNTLGNYVKSIGLLFTPEGAKQIGGFGAIGGMFPSTWDWETFWLNTAFISIILAFMNLLPIPALDGGHVMFLLWEIITRKPVPEKFLERAQMVGMMLLIGLLLYANGNDIIKAIFGG